MKEDMVRELHIEALPENLPWVTDFTEAFLSEAGCPMKAMMQIGVAMEEIYVNVASYAYQPDTGPVLMREEITDGGSRFTVTFIDGGRPYNPLEKEDPDVTLGAEERPIGGLGIYMTKKIMDEVHYAYEDGKNILRLSKKIVD